MIRTVPDAGRLLEIGIRIPRSLTISTEFEARIVRGAGKWQLCAARDLPWAFMQIPNRHKDGKGRHRMQVEISTGNQLDPGSDFLGYVEATVTDALGRYGDQIIRVLVHFGDENSTAKAGDNDKRCTLEARVGGLEPVAVIGNGSTLEQALENAVDKMTRTLDRTLERLHDPKGRTPAGGEPHL